MVAEFGIRGVGVLADFLGERVIYGSLLATAQARWAFLALVIDHDLTADDNGINASHLNALCEQAPAGTRRQFGRCVRSVAHDHILPVLGTRTQSEKVER